MAHGYVVRLYPFVSREVRIADGLAPGYRHWGEYPNLRTFGSGAWQRTLGVAVPR